MLMIFMKGKGPWQILIYKIVLELDLSIDIKSNNLKSMRFFLTHTALSQVVCTLTALTDLSLKSNELTALTPLVGNLVELRTLDVR